MDKRYLYPMAAVLLLVALLGIGADGVIESENTTPATETTESGGEGHGSLQQARLKVYPNKYNNNGNRTLEVGIDAQVWDYPEFSYEGVELCLYDSEGRVLDQRTIGTIRSPETGKFEERYQITAQPDRRPTYIVVDHPRLRNDSRFQVDLNYWEDDAWQLTYKSLDDIQDDFEWPRTNETGECG